MKLLVRIVVGYVCAVTAAALCQAIWSTVVELKHHDLSMPPARAIWEMFSVGWSYAFVMAILPFSVGVHIELGRAMSKPLFFVVGATITGALLLLPPVYLSGGVVDQTDVSLLERYWNLLPRFAASGLAAGSIYYLVREFPRTRDFVRQTGNP